MRTAINVDKSSLAENECIRNLIYAVLVVVKLSHSLDVICAGFGQDAAVQTGLRACCAGSHESVVSAGIRPFRFVQKAAAGLKTIMAVYKKFP